jgi:hypothetical protein
MNSIMRLPIRITAALIRTRSVLFFEKHGPEILPSESVVELHENDLAALKADPTLPWSVELGGLSHFAEGGRFFAVEREGAYLSFGWAMRADRFQVGEIGGVVHVTMPVLWIWRCFTAPEHRGNGHYPMLLAGIRRLMDEPSTLIYCTPENATSRHGILKAGFEDAFRLTKHRLFVICTKDARKLFSGYERLT